MPKRLPFIKNQSGFVLPYVLFLGTLILIILTGSITLYQNEVHITQMELEEIKIETLLQSGHAAFMTEFQDSIPDDKVHYQFSQGSVKIQYIEPIHRIHMSITTDHQTVRSFSIPLSLGS